MAFQPVLSARYDTDTSSTGSKFSSDDTVKRKTPSIFHRPAKKSPEAQWEYANSLLARGKQKAAMKEYRDLVYQWHTSSNAPAAQLAYARILYDRNDYRTAFDEYQYLIENFAGQFPYDEALDKQFRIANYLMEAKRMKFLFFPGFSIQEQAMPLFEKIVKNAPGWKNSAEAQYNIGLINENKSEYAAAIQAYNNVFYKFPASDKVADASFRKAYCLYLMANKAPCDENLCRQALSALAGFIGDYPRHGSARKAKEYRDILDDRLLKMYYDRAVFYDKTPGKAKSAQMAYEDFLNKFPLSEPAGKARERVDVLKKQIADAEALQKEKERAEALKKEKVKK